MTWLFANLGVRYKYTMKGVVSLNGTITGVRGDSMICSTGELYRKLLPSFQTVITLCTLSVLFLLRGTSYRRPRIGSNWCNVSVPLTPVKLVQRLQRHSSSVIFVLFLILMVFPHCVYFCDKLVLLILWVLLKADSPLHNHHSLNICPLFYAFYSIELNILK